MSDRAIRKLARAPADDLETQARLLVQRVRAGDLTRGRLALAAFASDPAALLAYGCDHTTLFQGLYGCVCFLARGTTSYIDFLQVIARWDSKFPELVPWPAHTDEDPLFVATLATVAAANLVMAMRSPTRTYGNITITYAAWRWLRKPTDGHTYARWVDACVNDADLWTPSCFSTPTAVRRLQLAADAVSPDGDRHYLLRREISAALVGWALHNHLPDPPPEP